MWDELIVALALVFILEGVFPFINPGGVKRVCALVTQMDGSVLRFAGISSIVLGLILLYLV